MASYIDVFTKNRYRALIGLVCGIALSISGFMYYLFNSDRIITIHTSYPLKVFPSNIDNSSYNKSSDEEMYSYLSSLDKSKNHSNYFQKNEVNQRKKLYYISFGKFDSEKSANVVWDSLFNGKIKNQHIEMHIKKREDNQMFFICLGPFDTYAKAQSYCLDIFNDLSRCSIDVR